MQNQSLREALAQLDHEIKKIETLDEQGQALLADLAADIQDLLERSETGSQADAPVATRLEKTIEHFELSHPELTATLSDLSAILSNAGI
ncbi:MAG: DUF4404 family protein [Anaerolineales bacterium]|jgi:hypothetical protein|nr:DUF4404 family protein [Anaerolineales bacterium]